ncbi:hypothetical protein EX30DRAFT_354598 [Ascodesmis nigricans]|uniref:Zn(2)-C6 fungal-type domain-containing protein n=1 Tax=Ascodesmis nigricans TaxID=341454 RepID=A0A4V3SJ42_9PEZI|nr:hypothetical protein EX30DRAFT_354598 [Ascodesmis nigricans]
MTTSSAVNSAGSLPTPLPPPPGGQPPLSGPPGLAQPGAPGGVVLSASPPVTGGSGQASTTCPQTHLPGVCPSTRPAVYNGGRVRLTNVRTHRCIPCRQRKVRCDLGSVEAPHDPPCVRCRRESKDCFFSATRRKKTPNSEIPPGLGRGRLLRKRDDEIEPLSFKRARTQDGSEASDDADSSSFRSPLKRHFDQQIDPSLQDSMPPTSQDQKQNNATSADTILQSELYNSHEALLTLIEAAGKDTPGMLKSESRDSSDEEEEDSIVSGHVRTNSSGTMHRSPMAIPGGRYDRAVRFSSMSDGKTSSTGSHPRPLHRRKASTVVSPLAQGERPGTVDSDDDGIGHAINAWNKFRFVKAGWFTAREAIGFMEYFYHNMHPLSPTLTNPSLLHASNPRHHHMLLRHEPFLATVILTVASRYMTLPGPGGASRSFAIHDMLWREVRNAFERIMWGGGWGGLGIIKPIGVSANVPVAPPNGATTGRGLRTLGTVEALMVLTEWHVRGIHFPMDVEESDWGIEISDDESEPVPKLASMGGIVMEGLGERLENILEPAYRSDRMSWMLLGNALALAYELGVFDETEGTVSPAPTPPATGKSGESQVPFRVRSRRIQRLLVVYIMQLASRIGWTSMIPRGVRETVRNQQTPLPPNPDWSNPNDLQDAVFTFWVELSMFMTSSAEVLFPNKIATRELMRTGRYVSLLELYQPQLRQHKANLDALRLPPAIHHILVLEYEHVRFYINSLALQAVIDRCSLASQNNNPANGANSANGNSGNTNSPFAALREMNSQDVEYIREVVDASRSLLSTVAHHMHPSGYLRHAPVRVFFRILSAAMFLLKTFVLGAKEVEVKESMTLVEATCDCLRSSTVDDLHLGVRFADMLGALAQRVRQRFVKVQRSGNGIESAASPAPPGMLQQGCESDNGNTATDQANNDNNNNPFFEYRDGQTPHSGFTPGPFPDHHHQHHHLDSNGHHHPHQDTNGNDVMMGNYEMGHQPTTPGGSGAWGWGADDWLALPLDPLMGFENNMVTQGTMGPDVGGMDLLEVLLSGNNNGT